MDRSEPRSKHRSLALTAALAVAGGAGLLLGAAPASAGDEFERAFRDEMGRIVAHEAVAGGRQLLAGILLGGYGARHHAPVRQVVYESHSYPPPQVYVEEHHYYGKRHHYRKHVRHERRHHRRHHHGHDRYDDCDDGYYDDYDD